MSAPVSSPTLLQRIAAGDSAAVRACLEEYGGLVWSLARRYLSALGDDVEDAVQEVFVELWRNASRFDPSKGSEPAFIATIAHRRLTDRQRRARLRRSDELPDDRVLGGPGAMPVAFAASDAKDAAKSAAEALEKLPAEERQVLWLTLYQGLSHERIATLTSQPVGTVKTRIRRGLARLREFLGVQMPQPVHAVAGGGVTP